MDADNQCEDSTDVTSRCGGGVGSGSVRSSILSVLPDLFSSDGKANADPLLIASSVSPASSHAGTPHKKRSMFDFATKKSPRSRTTDNEEVKDYRKENHHDQIEEATATDRSFNFRNWLSSDLQREAHDLEQEAQSLKRERRASARATMQGDVTRRLEKVKQKREARSKERNFKHTEMKSLMEQVASIAAQSRGIMRAQPKQSEQQKLMGEIITHMGKMAEKMSKLMLVTDREEDEEEDETNRSGENTMTAEVAEEKAEQILALLGGGEDSYELEWKRLEIKSILTSETNHPRKRTTDKSRALEVLALSEAHAPRSSSSVSRSVRSSSHTGSSTYRSRLSRAGSTRSTGSQGRRSRSTRRSRSIGNDNTERGPEKPELDIAMSEESFRSNVVTCTTYSTEAT